MGSRCEVIAMNSDAKTQSERWKHLIQLIQRQMIIYPGHSKARRTRVWRRFRQQMSDAEKVMKGQYLLIEAPHERKRTTTTWTAPLWPAPARSVTRCRWSRSSTHRSTGEIRQMRVGT